MGRIRGKSERVTITRWEEATEGDGYLLAFVGATKALFQGAVLAVKSLDYADRQWMPDAGCWWIRREAVADLAERFPALHALLNECPRPAPTSSRPMPPDVAKAFVALHLLPSAPDELVAATRRVLARRYHPDTGGAHAAMVAINDAADRIESFRATRPEASA